MKQVWLNYDEHIGQSSLCIRMKPKNWLAITENEFPPIEKIDGKRLNIEKSNQLGLTEKHYVLSYLSDEDLQLLRDVINTHLERNLK